MITALGFFGTVLDGYLIYIMFLATNNCIKIPKSRLLLFIILNASAIFLIKSTIHLNAISLTLSMLVLFLFPMFFFGFELLNFLAWLIWMVFAVVSEFISFLPFMIFSDMAIVSVIRDDNGFSILALILSKFLQFVFVFVFCRLRGDDKVTASLSFSQISLFIICFLLLFCVMFNYYWSLMGTPIPSVFAILFTVCIIAFLLVALYNIDSVMKHAQEKEDFALMNMRVSHSIEASSLVEKMHDIRHDCRHHMQAMYALLDKEMYKEAREYYNDVLDDFTELESRFIDNQPIINSLIFQKLHSSEKDGVRFSIKVPSELDTNIKNTDLCAIFSNILDNAFEACVKSDSERYVNLYVYVANDSFFIDIENSTADIVENKSGVFKSTKPEPLNHGYGLRSVRKLVLKYDGEIKIYPNNSEKVFKVSIALPLTVKNP